MSDDMIRTQTVSHGQDVSTSEAGSKFPGAPEYRQDALHESLHVSPEPDSSEERKISTPGSGNPQSGTISMTSQIFFGSDFKMPIDEQLKLLDAELKRIESIKSMLNAKKESSKTGAKKESSETGDEAEDDWEDDKVWAKHVVCTPDIRYVDWYHFKHLNHCGCIKFRKWAKENACPPKPAAIEVLVGPAKYYWDKRLDDSYRALGTNSASSLPEPKTPVDSPMRFVDTPDRIRINSKPILAFLSELGEPVGVGNSCVFLHPYKVLVHHQNDIEDHLNGLRRLHGNHVTTGPGEEHQKRASESKSDAPVSVHVPAADNALMYGRSALYEFESLQYFISKYITPKQKFFRGTECHKIRFRDLWYLYKPGDMVIGFVNRRNHTKDGQDAADAQERQKSSSDETSFEKYQAWKVLSLDGGRPFLGPDDSEPNTNRSPTGQRRCSNFRIQVYRIDFNGTQFILAWNVVIINWFEGEQDISSLQLVPLRLHKAQNAIRETLQTSGQDFLQYQEPRHRFYEGSTVMQLQYGGIDPRSQVRHIFTPVMVDFKESAKALGVSSGYDPAFGSTVQDPRETNEGYETKVWCDHQGNRHSCSHTDFIQEDIRYDVVSTENFIEQDAFLSNVRDFDGPTTSESWKFSNDDLMLLPQFVLGFAFQGRQFYRLRLDCLKEISVDSNAWEDLQLRSDYKILLLAHLKSYFRARSTRSGILGKGLDIVKGKGMGLTFLLHGEPGVGKTSTVECIAAKLGRPLYPITCGDIGTTAATVSVNLREIFSKAEKWNCLLLLDEADVFLADRSKQQDIERNAIVSVFLNALEFYNGVLFLTTNRVGTFDHAFRSRIHFPLYYSRLSSDQTKEIWKMNIRRLREQGGTEQFTVDPDQEDLLDYARELWKGKQLRWNGRQIKNAFQSAVALAEHEANESTRGFAETQLDSIKLSRRHFTQVVEAGEDFERYLGSVWGMSESKRAYHHQLRRDDYGEQNQRSSTFRDPHGVDSRTGTPGYQRDPRTPSGPPGMWPQPSNVATPPRYGFASHQQSPYPAAPPFPREHSSSAAHGYGDPRDPYDPQRGLRGSSPSQAQFEVRPSVENDDWDA
ncbi:hypothetical protein F4780DRAFT_89192 [Xylariomycetidae sp. FL0641]|nr:hypothetical protein F4780DRAFT_89192 [Xylariomycetidae sp. FL0641]